MNNSSGEIGFVLGLLAVFKGQAELPWGLIRRIVGGGVCQPLCRRGAKAVTGWQGPEQGQPGRGAVYAQRELRWWGVSGMLGQDPGLNSLFSTTLLGFWTKAFHL